MQTKNKGLGVVGIAAATVLTCLAAAVTILSATAYQFINQYWSGFSATGNSALPADFTSNDAIAESKAVNIQAMEEGSVLLRNEKSTLPLANKKINLFGYYSAKPISGAFGSVTTGDATIENMGFKQGFEEAGLSVNEDLYNYNVAHAADADNGSYLNMYTDFKINEIPYSKLETAGMIANAKAYSDTAVYVMGRTASEKQDIPTTYDGEGVADSHYLRIVSTEKAMLEGLKKDFSKVIVVLNTASTMELGFLETYNVDACVYCATPGTYGTIGLGNVLLGKACPSGHTSTTYAYDETICPAFYTYGTNKYSNFADYSDINTWSNKKVKEADANLEYYYHYYEGIYVGYRYYETRYIGDDNAYSAAEEASYKAAVQYPFGYGLSYTTFDWSSPTWTIGKQGGEIKATVDVKNVGDVAGKDVVELYVTPPYTPNGIEKSAVVLEGYGKTKLLNPGETDTVTITFNFDDMASYDYKTAKCYVLDKGDYTLSLRSNAHTAKDGLTKTFTIADQIVYDEANNGKRSSDQVAAVNQFDSVSKGDGSITYVSRHDWEGTMPKTLDSAKNIAASAEVIAAIKNESNGALVDPVSKDEEHLSSTADWIKTSQSNGVTVADYAGLTDYNSPLWDKLLDEMSIDEMRELYGDGAYRVASVRSIGMKKTVDTDGPQGVTATTTGQYSTAFVAGSIWACTWNQSLCEEIGRKIGHEFLLCGITGIYGPSINIMRTPFNGRNGEYLTEDGLLNGKTVAAYTRGAQEGGCYVYMKHFVAYGCASNASCMTWLNEQELREIYLHGFELGVKEGQAHGMMVSFGRLGTGINTCNYGLMNTVARKEWGFVGCFVSDGISTSNWDVNLGIRAGLNLILDSSWDAQMISWSESTVDDSTTKTNYGQHCLRECAKQLVYRYCNSAASTAVRNWTPTWLWIVGAADVLFLGGAVCCVIFLVKPAFFPKKKEEGKE